jgi:hypothetical protein
MKMEGKWRMAGLEQDIGWRNNTHDNKPTRGEQEGAE